MHGMYTKYKPKSHALYIKYKPIFSCYLVAKMLVPLVYDKEDLTPLHLL